MKRDIRLPGKKETQRRAFPTLELRLKKNTEGYRGYKTLYTLCKSPAKQFLETANTIKAVQKTFLNHTVKLKNEWNERLHKSE